MRWLGSAALLAALVAGCGGSDDALVVSAASSLTDAFTEVERAFESEHPTVDVRLNLAGSATLREQILEGASVDVFASADEATMRAVAESFGVAATEFASNQLRLAVAPGNPGGVRDLASLADPALFIGLCAPEVPCGAVAGRVLAAAGLQPAVDTLEASVRALVVKLEAGELDAALLYHTDVLASDLIEGVEVDLGALADTSYFIAVLGDPPSPWAVEFVEFVGSPAGRQILSRHGFGVP